MQDLQLELERMELRPVTVHEWAVAAGHPSAHQLMAALQEGRRAERTMVHCHRGLVRSVALRCVGRVVGGWASGLLCRRVDPGQYRHVKRSANDFYYSFPVRDYQAYEYGDGVDAGGW